MSAYRKPLLTFFTLAALLCTDLVLGQTVKTQFVLQQGHGGTIDKIRISPNKRFFATSGQDAKIVIWEYNSGRQVLFKQLKEKVTELTFSPTGDSLYFMNESSKVLYALSVSDTSITIQENDSIPILKHREVFFDDKRVDLSESTINLYQWPSNKRIKQQTCDYFEDPFLNVVYCARNTYLYVGCQDGTIYVFDKQLNRVVQLKGHMGAVTDLAISPEGRFLFSVSEDRSVIRWNLDNHTIIARSVGYNFPLVSTTVFERDNLHIVFGDEAGNVSNLEISRFNSKMSSSPTGYKAITKLGVFSKNILFAGGEGRRLHFYHTDNPRDALLSPTNLLSSFTVSPYGIANALDFVYEDVLGLYRKPLAHLNNVALNPNGNVLLTSNQLFMNSKFPALRFYEFKDGKIRRSRRYFHLFRESGVLNEAKNYSYHTAELNDSTFVTTLGNHYSMPKQVASSLYFWRIPSSKNKKIAFNEVDFKENIRRIYPFSDTLLLYDSPSILGVYNVYSGEKETFPSNHIGVLPLTHQMSLIQYPDFSFKLLSKNGSFSRGLIGHFDTIKAASLLSEHHKLITACKDGTLRFWDTDSLSLIATLIPTGVNNFVVITPDNYYYLSSRKVSSFGFKKGAEFFLPEQFDALYNRPDIVFNRLGFTDTSVIRMYQEAYHKRMNKLGVREELLKGDFHLPTTRILNEDSIAPLVSNRYLAIAISANDSKYLLDHINVWINEVPIYGKKGIDLKQLNTSFWEDTLQLELGSGENKIQISVHNQAGVESFRETVYVNYAAEKTKKPDLYLLTIGVSNYLNSLYNLRYAAKDAQDIAHYFSNETTLFDSIHQIVLTDEEVSVERILDTKKMLQRSTRDDVVLVSYAGHGVLDNNYHYFLATHNIDFDSPQNNGLAYEDLEDLLDSIKPLKKVLLIDACHSGELDKESVASSQSSTNGVQSKPVGRGVIVDLQSNPYQVQTSHLAKELFADLRRGNGATIISASGGMEFAMESSDWKNGLFTYCLLHGLKSMQADKDRNKQIRLSELQIYLEEEVSRLSGGIQKPTSRRENVSLDFRLK